MPPDLRGGAFPDQELWPAAIGEGAAPDPGCASIPGGLHLAFPNKCRHCDPAPCQEVCIAGAISRDAARGTVDIDPQRCITCAMCAMACPFGVLTYAPVYRPRTRPAVALKCDQCPDREKVGRVPACVEACKVGALTYGEWQEAQEDKGRALAQAFFASLPAAEDGPRHPAGDPPLAAVGVTIEGFLRGGPGDFS